MPVAPQLSRHSLSTSIVWCTIHKWTSITRSIRCSTCASLRRERMYTRHLSFLCSRSIDRSMQHLTNHRCFVLHDGSHHCTMDGNVGTLESYYPTATAQQNTTNVRSRSRSSSRGAVVAANDLTLPVAQQRPRTSGRATTRHSP